MEPWFAALARPTAAVPSAAAHNTALAWAPPEPARCANEQAAPAQPAVHPSSPKPQPQPPSHPHYDRSLFKRHTTSPPPPRPAPPPFRSRRSCCCPCFSPLVLVFLWRREEGRVAPNQRARALLLPSPPREQVGGGGDASPPPPARASGFSGGHISRPSSLTALSRSGARSQPNRQLRSTWRASSADIAAFIRSSLCRLMITVW